MIKKLLIWFFSIVLLSAAVNAALSDGLVVYYTLDNIITDSVDGTDLTKNGSAVVNSSGLINYASEFSHNYDFYRNVTTINSTNVTINLWIYKTGAGSLGSDDAKIIGDANTWAQGGISLHLDNAGGDIDAQLYASGGSSNCNDDTGIVPPTNGWTMITLYIDGTGGNVTIYVNGTVGSSVVHNDCKIIWEFPLQFQSMASSPAKWFQGRIDEVGYWNRTLTQTEITQLFNGGAGTRPIAVGTDIALTATDDYNGSSINNFSVNISWGNGTTTAHSTTNGTVNLNNVSHSDLNINVTYFNVTNYYNLTLISQAITANVSNTITAGLYQAVVNMVARQKISNNTLSGGTFYVGGLSGSVFNLTAATHTINFTHPNYYDLNGTSFVISALTNTTQTINGVYSSIANLSVHYPNGTLINNWGVNLTSITYSNWSGETGGTTNGSYYFNLINGTYQAIINSSEGNETFTFTINSSVQNITYYYFGLDNCTSYTDVILNFTIRNEITDALLNDSLLNIWFNVTSSGISSYRTFNISFEDGNYYTVCVANNTITSWTADAQAEYSNLPTYAEKNYYLVDYPLNATQQDITLYLTNGTTQVTLSIRDYNDDPITDAYISVLSYDLGTNSYTTTEIVKTDTEGDAFIQIIQNTAWYSFLVEYDGEVIIQTLPTKITTSSLTLRANLETDYFASYDVTHGITSDLMFNNNTGTFSFTFSDPTGGVTQGCLVLTRISINGETQLNISCATSSAATILVTIPEAFGTNSYKAEGYATISNQNFLLETETYSYNKTFKTFGLEGIFLSMLLILTLVMVGLWHPVASVVLMVVGVIATNVMGLFYLNWTYIITFIILAVITIYRTGRSE